MSFDLSKMSQNTGTEVSGVLGFQVLQMLQVKIDYRDGLVDFCLRPEPVEVRPPTKSGRKAQPSPRFLPPVIWHGRSIASSNINRGMGNRIDHMVDTG